MSAEPVRAAPGDTEVRPVSRRAWPGLLLAAAVMLSAAAALARLPDTAVARMIDAELARLSAPASWLR